VAWARAAWRRQDRELGALPAPLGVGAARTSSLSCTPERGTEARGAAFETFVCFGLW
jgi:hypothetical protein